MSLQNDMIQKIDMTVHLDRLRIMKDDFETELSTKAGLPVSKQIEINHLRNVLHRRIVRQVLYIGQSHMEKRGLPLPCNYAFILLGSGGRGELAQHSDQDNGIIYDSSPDNHPKAPFVEQYFTEFTQWIESALIQVGYPACEGKVTCNHPTWRRSLSAWIKQLNEWTDEKSWESIRYLLIAADMDAVYGTFQLKNKLMDHFFELVHSNQTLIQAMLQNTAFQHRAIGMFGNLIRIQYGPFSGGVEIKNNIYIPIVNHVRLLSLIHNIKETSTLRRLQSLEQKGIITKSTLDLIVHDWAQTLYLRSLTATQSQNGVVESSGIIPEEQLTKSVREQIKQIYRTIKILQRLLHEHTAKKALRNDRRE